MHNMYVRRDVRHVCKTCMSFPSPFGRLRWDLQYLVTLVDQIPYLSTVALSNVALRAVVCLKWSACGGGRTITTNCQALITERKDNLTILSVEIGSWEEDEREQK